MPAVSVSIAEAVKDYLADAIPSITPERSYADWELPLEDDALHVDVVAVTTQQKITPETRAKKVRYDIPIHIAVRKRFTTEQKDSVGRVQVAEVDALVLLVEQIHEQFTQERLTDFEDGVWKETKILVSPMTEHLRQAGQFTGIVEVLFQVYKQL